jgi:hypothetical protein
VQVGDDPAWSRVDFDDSKWLPVDAKTQLREDFPGKHADIVWRRIHVKVSPQETYLALQAYSLSRAYEVYVNGEKLIASGPAASNALQSTYNIRVGILNLHLADFGYLCFNFSLAIIIVLRSTRMSREQAMLEGEMAAAEVHSSASTAPGRSPSPPQPSSKRPRSLGRRMTSPSSPSNTLCPTQTLSW